MIDIDESLKVVLKASRIPNDSLVTKVSGSKEYHMKHDIKVYLEDGKQQVIKGCFIIDELGNINQINPETNLCFYTTPRHFHELVEKYYDEKES